MIEHNLLVRLTRELRNAAGIERTPGQVEKWLAHNVQRPASFARKVVNSHDELLILADRMRIKILEDAPPSSEWGD